MRKEFKIVQGRMFKPGTNELIVGDGAMKQYVGLDVGKQGALISTDWTVVGRFTDDGGHRRVGSLGRHGDGAAGLAARAGLPDHSRQAREKPLRSRRSRMRSPRTRSFHVDVLTEKQFYVDQQKAMSKLINGIGLWIAIIMGLAALFAALNTLDSAIASRVREIATLRAMGFGAMPVVFSVLVEAMILGAIGGLAGGLCAFLLLNGMTSSTLNFASFSQITYAFTVTPVLLLLGIVLRAAVMPACRYPAGHPGGAAAHHGRSARIVTRRLSFTLLGALALAGASSFAQAEVWTDIEGRIQYAYYTNDSRALNSVLTSLKPKGGEGEGESGNDAAMRHYFLALTHYRIAQVMVAVKKSQAKDAIDECGDEVDEIVDALPKVPLGVDETDENRMRRVEAYALGTACTLAGREMSSIPFCRRPHRLAHRRSGAARAEESSSPARGSTGSVRARRQRPG